MEDCNLFPADTAIEGTLKMKVAEAIKRLCRAYEQEHRSRREGPAWILCRWQALTILAGWLQCC
jgi:hypothetical protein